jgi:hypothetical protein
MKGLKSGWTVEMAGSTGAGSKDRQDEPLAKSLSGCDMRQGTASVVLKWLHLDSGFNRCGIANRRKYKMQGLKPIVFADLPAQLKPCQGTSAILKGFCKWLRMEIPFVPVNASLASPQIGFTARKTLSIWTNS